jgi:hypothetical protein
VIGKARDQRGRCEREVDEWPGELEVALTKYVRRPDAAAVPSPGTAKPASSPTPAEPRRIPNGTLSDTGIPSRSAASVTNLACVKFA